MDVKQLSEVKFKNILTETDRTNRIKNFVDSLIMALNNMVKNSGETEDSFNIRKVKTIKDYTYEYGINIPDKNSILITDIADGTPYTPKYILKNTVQNIPETKTRTQYLTEYIDALNSNVNKYSAQEIKNELDKREKIEIQKIIVPSLNVKYALDDKQKDFLEDKLKTGPIQNANELTSLAKVDAQRTPIYYFNDLDTFYKTYNIGKTEQFRPEKTPTSKPSDYKENPADIRNVLAEIRNQITPTSLQPNEYTRYVMFFTFKEDSQNDCNYYKASFEFAKSISSKVASKKAATTGGRGIRKRVSKKRLAVVTPKKAPKQKKTSKVRG
jgi:hypothetical protein